MLTVETIGRIRRERFVNGKTIRQIARDRRRPSRDGEYNEQRFCR
jgi:hypothetical protein